MNSIKGKLIMSVTALVVVTIMTLSIAGFTIAKDSLETTANDFFVDELSMNIDTLDIYIEDYYGQLIHSGDAFTTSDGSDVYQDYQVVDRFYDISGNHATIFLKDGDDFKRITTSIVKSDGARAVDTYLGKDSAAYGPVMKGETFHGEANILGEAYVTVYKPIMVNNEVVGILFVGTSQAAVNASIADDLSKMRNIMVLLGLVLTLISIGIIYYASNALAKHITKIATYTDYIASGDLTFEIDEKALQGKTEIGMMSRRFNEMLASLHSVISKIQSASGDVNETAGRLSVNVNETVKASEEVSRTVSEIAEGATEQANNVENGTHEVSLIGTAVERNSDLTEGIINKALSISQSAEAVMTQMDELRDKTEETMSIQKEIYEGIQKTDTSADRISEASDLIASIADQTNLLALNAAIEAARAGDAGKGFAVVAEEIRKLAEQSNRSTEEINKIINELKLNSTKSVEVINTSNQVMQVQFESVKTSEEKYNEIYHNINEFLDMLSEIKESSQEMIQQKNHLLSIMESLSAIAEENAASTEEVSASQEEITATMADIGALSQSMTELSKVLDAEVANFKI